MQQDAKSINQNSIHDVRKNIVQRLDKSLQPDLSVTFQEKTWKFHPPVISYRCDIPDGKNISEMRRDAVMYPRFWCPSSHQKYVKLKLG